jgi:hypothetical protein
LKLNTGDTTYGPSIPVTLSSTKRFWPGYIKLTDLNKDGWPDLVLTQTDLDGNNSDTLVYALGLPDYRFNEPVSIVLPEPVRRFEIADIDANGYEDIIVAGANKHVYVLLADAPAEEEPQHDIRVFPNPSTGWLHVRDEKARGKIITVFNMAGQQIQQLISKEQLTKMNTAALPAGMYFLHIQMGGESVSLPFMKR